MSATLTHIPSQERVECAVGSGVSKLWGVGSGASSPCPVSCMWPRMARNAAQHKIVNFLKTFFCSSVFVSVCVFNVWPKTTLLPLWPRDASRLDTPGGVSQSSSWLHRCRGSLGAAADHRGFPERKLFCTEILRHFSGADTCARTLKADSG